MSEVSNKRFVRFSGKKEDFIDAGYPKQYNDSIVFINADGDDNYNCIYTNEQYYGDKAFFKSDVTHSIARRGSWLPDGNYSVNIGKNCDIQGEYSFATGKNITSTTPYSFVCGKYNSPNVDMLFGVGCGSEVAQKNAMVIKSNGDIYVKGVGYYDGTIPQGYPLHKAIELCSNSIIHITYSEIVNLVRDGLLLEGREYVISDYLTRAPQPKWVGTYEMSYGSMCIPFCVVVKAISANELSEEGRCYPSVDTPQSMYNLCKQWKVWYTINSSDDRFAWTNATGIIYRMIDENGNDCPYDFKNITFMRKSWYKPSLNITFDAKYLFKMKDIINRYIGNFAVRYASQTSDYEKIWEDEELLLKSSAESKTYFLTFNDIVSYPDDYSTKVKCNIIKPNYLNGKQILNNNIFFGLCNFNVLDYYCYDNTFYESSQCTLSQSCGKNILSQADGTKIDMCCIGNLIHGTTNQEIHTASNFNYIDQCLTIYMEGFNRCNAIIRSNNIRIGHDSGTLSIIDSEKIDIAHDVNFSSIDSSCEYLIIDSFNSDVHFENNCRYIKFLEHYILQSMDSTSGSVKNTFSGEVISVYGVKYTIIDHSF